jgi:hypothetical protein
MVPSYFGAALRREPRYDDPDVRRYLRRKQSLGAAFRRARAA